MFCTNALWEPNTVYWGDATKFTSHCALSSSSAPSVPVMMVGTLVTNLLGGDAVDDDKAVEDDAVNSSYEEIEDQGGSFSKACSFWWWWKICLSLHFRNSEFSADYVRQVILQSPIDGWQITYQQELFTTTTFFCENECTYKSLLMFCFSKVKKCTKFRSNVITQDK